MSGGSPRSAPFWCVVALVATIAGCRRHEGHFGLAPGPHPTAAAVRSAPSVAASRRFVRLLLESSNQLRLAEVAVLRP